MSIDRLNPRTMRHYDGTARRYVLEGKLIFPKGRSPKAIHFHSNEHLSLEKATELLRSRHLIEPNEDVISLESCGKGGKGIEGYGARTDQMTRVPENSVSSNEHSQILWGIDSFSRIINF